MPKKLYLAVIIQLLTVALFSGCGSDKSPAKEKQVKEVVVFAAASMTESLTEIAENFEKQEGSNTKVVLNFAGSQALKTSIEAGTRADIFASANIKYMDELKNEGFVKDYRVFLKNRLVIVKNRSSKFHIEELADLSAEGLKIATGDKNVPVGLYWEKAFEKALEDKIITDGEKAGIEKNIKTREINVKDVVSKVLLNEVDAGIVYRTDVTEAVSEKVQEIDIPVFEQFEADYPIAILKDSQGHVEVEKFYNYILSDKGRGVFKKYKFIAD